MKSVNLMWGDTNISYMKLLVQFGHLKCSLVRFLTLSLFDNFNKGIQIFRVVSSLKIYLPGTSRLEPK
jgi:hypothetical protein